MAEQDAPHQQSDESLETAKARLQEKQKRRDDATSNLQGAEDLLKEAQQNLAGLQEKEQRLQRQHTERAAELEDIPRRIEATQQTLENLQAKQQQLQNQEALSSGALARLIRKLTRKPARLTRRIEATQQTLENLQAKLQQLPGQHTEDAAELERLKLEIEEAKQTKEDKEGEVKNLRGELDAAESKVLAKALKVREKASEEILELARSLLPNSPKKLAGGVSVGYVSVLFTNLSYNYVFYDYFGICIFDHSEILYFAAPHLESLIIANVFVWIYFLSRWLKKINSRTTPKEVERGAVYLASKAERLTSTKGTILSLLPLFILSFILVPGIFALGNAESISDSKVDVVTVRELKPLKEQVYIGSNSTHAFFYDSDNTKTTVAIPLSGIVCISDKKSYCEPNEATPPEVKTGPVVIVYEPPPKDQPCEDCIPSVLTDGMQFYLVHQEPASLENPARGGLEINEVNAGWFSAFKSALASCSQSGPPAQVRVYGFASSELPRHLNSPEANIYNCKVANRRAEEAIDFLVGDNQKYGTSEEYCKDQEELSQEELEKLYQKKPDTFTGKDGELTFKIEYLPWQTFQAMENSRPVIDEPEGRIIPKRALLNRSVRLTIVEAGGCESPTSATNTSGSPNSQ